MEIVHFIPPNQRRLCMLAAQAESTPVLIVGATGTGKSAIARWIHSNGTRSVRRCITASKDHSLAAQIAEARGGTLVVPEVGSLPLSEQKVLEVFLTSRTIPHPSDNGTNMLINVRVIATSSQSLEGRARGGLFNNELLRKLDVFRIEMPELRKRTSEFEDIVNGIVSEITREIHKEHVKELSPSVWKLFREYEWPGNLRELRNVLRMAVVQTRGDMITENDLPEFGHDRVDFRATREDFEKIYITELLKTFGGEVSKACQVSRIDKKTLVAKIKKYGIGGSKDQPAL